MARQSECEHDIANYHVIGGNGLDVVEACGVCGERITHDSPKTALENQIKEEEREERKKKAAAKKRREAKEEESFVEKTKDKFVDLFEDE